MMKVLFLMLALCTIPCCSQFVDDMQIFEPACLGEEIYQCLGGGCVPSYNYCDGNIDCDDGSDENFCTDHRPDAILCNQTHQYLCLDQKRCIPNTWICNGDVDCEDGSDEMNCTRLPEITKNSTCKGFVCDGGRCISRLWTCDGTYDCKDRTDEDIDTTCRHALLAHTVNDGVECREFPELGSRNYKCLDSSFCLAQDQMCDGIHDCRDGSDEGKFCDKWHTMCANFSCGGNNTACSPERGGPTCICLLSNSMMQYNNTTKRCENVNVCQQAKPQCSHSCENKNGYFVCECDTGYVKDALEYLCYAPGPEAILFFSTRNDIQYVTLKSKQHVRITLASDIKQAHGVSYDGNYIYWVETAQGHQSIVRSNINSLEDSKEVLVALGLEDPGDIAVDWLGGNIYFSDAERGIISACKSDGSICKTIHTETRHPKYVTLDVKRGRMYWSDWHNQAIIMQARMDGTDAEVLVHDLAGFATGLSMDAPNQRLYFVDKTIKVVKVDDGKVYSLFNEPFHHPYSIAVFENTVFWSDWASNSILSADKLHGSTEKRNLLLSLDLPVFDMHIYHPVMEKHVINPCQYAGCTHMCLLTSNMSYVCACPDDMELVAGVKCKHIEDYRPHYLIVGGGASFTRIQYNVLGNPESHATHFDVGRIQAMAYDNVRDVLYLYDGQRKSINFISMKEFLLGVTHVFIYDGLENVVDMSYDYVTDSLYILDSGRRVIEVVSLKSKQRALLYHFRDEEIPISLCVMSDYGRMLVATVESEQNNEIHVDSIGLDGEDRKHLLMNNLMGPYVRLRYAQNMDVVFVSDEGHGTIDFVHPEGTGRENFRELSTTIASLAVTDNYVFWTGRRTSQLFWSDVHEITHKIRRIELSIFPNNTQLHILATTPQPSTDSPLIRHPCLTHNPCSAVCVQRPHTTPHHSPNNFTMGFKCLCPPGLVLKGGNCSMPANCKQNEFYCHKTNQCFLMSQKCDGKKDCLFGEDEEGCAVSKGMESIVCSSQETLCDGKCINKNEICNSDTAKNNQTCSPTQFQCRKDNICIERSLVCDGHVECPDGSDEDPVSCDTLSCFVTEFMCATGSCIPIYWRCDGSEDCTDGSDEFGCENKSCNIGQFQCYSRECIELDKRCDGQLDCFDHSDEDNCDVTDGFEAIEERPRCQPWEYTCEHNDSICLPLTVRCNAKVDCPGGTDEAGCDFRCAPHGLFECKQEMSCVAKKQLCDGKNDCMDGSDETLEACRKVNATLPRTIAKYPASECRNGYLCHNGQCIELSELCDGTPNCFDGSDENGQCNIGCETVGCEQRCVRTPQGPRCECRPGYKRAPPTSCIDIDECTFDVCSQKCRNVPGSFICSCHHGYALRSDSRSCKAVRGGMSVLYVSGNTVRAVFPDYKQRLEYHDKNLASINDLDFNVRKNLLYVASAASGKLIEVNSTRDDVSITNIGRPTKVGVDWITGNVYFVDSTPGASCFRVCNMRKKRCAKLQKLPTDAQVTALAIDPAARRMFYCINRELESVVRSASLNGRRLSDVATVRNCTGIAVDSFTRMLYVAETGPSHILRMDYEGNNMKTVLSNYRSLQAPRGLAIFEDSIFFLGANTFKLNRCLLHGVKTCEPYLYLQFDANTFVLRHESVQRDDVTDECERVTCAGVCTLDDAGPACVCDSGALSNDGTCPLVKQAQLPLFNGWLQQDYVRHAYSYTLIAIVLTLFGAYICLFIYYHFVRKPAKKRAGEYMQVRYQNNGSETMPNLGLDNPIFSVPPTIGGIAHEFVNPLQFVRDIWRQSLPRNRPVGTAGITFDSPQMRQDSDTESDLDLRETRRILRN
ncbi:PREDICTED: putative vitellogenin receptor isoform X2 [Papilio xuthus]|uniref:Vitellogenin receptor isoform X2 n=1 Tax=Papilio xuthus TaxID=66420 RepID=A0AAJ6ZYM5_PAPXU|nr:PREDICTED: putative vitellogenin receptor isoform X2 [Papilio xuthus]